MYYYCTFSNKDESLEDMTALKFIVNLNCLKARMVIRNKTRQTRLDTVAIELPDIIFIWL